MDNIKDEILSKLEEMDEEQLALVKTFLEQMKKKEEMAGILDEIERELDERL
ncbi:MAG: hypothetical protein QME46_00005 [Thermoanaerobacteraceae bacterium]|nr:hypothetical protein [Thermoanaerobacteraceae bacterium]